MVRPASHRIPRVRWYSGFQPLLASFRLQDFYLLRSCFPALFGYESSSFCRSATPLSPKTKRFGLFPFRSPLLRKSIFIFLFLRLLRCFSSPGSPRPAYVFSWWYRAFPHGAFPHSDIHGSMLVCSSPWLFAAYRVLLRLLMPRHPPYALFYLILKAFFRPIIFSNWFGYIACAMFLTLLVSVMQFSRCAALLGH